MKGSFLAQFWNQVQKNFAKKFWKIFEFFFQFFFFVFLVIIFQKLFYNWLFYYDFQICLSSFISFSFVQKKMTPIWENIFLTFFKTVVGTFCATCTVTGYPCFKMLMMNNSMKVILGISTMINVVFWIFFPLKMNYSDFLLSAQVLSTKLPFHAFCLYCKHF